MTKKHLIHGVYVYGACSPRILIGGPDSLLARGREPGWYVGFRRGHLGTVSGPMSEVEARRRAGPSAREIP